MNIYANIAYHLNNCTTWINSWIFVSFLSLLDMTNTSTPNPSHNGSLENDTDFSLLSASLDMQKVQNDEVAQAKVTFKHLGRVRDKYEVLCYNSVNELDEMKKKHLEEIENFHNDVEKKMNALQAELAKRTDELENMHIKMLATDAFNEKLQSFIESIYDRKWNFTLLFLVFHFFRLIWTQISLLIFFFFSVSAEIKKCFDEIKGKVAVEANECETMSLNSDDGTEQNQQQLNDDEANGGGDQRQLQESENENEQFENADEMEQDIPNETERDNEEGLATTEEENDSGKENEQPGEVVLPKASIAKKSVTLQKAVSAEQQKVADKKCFRCEETFVKETSFLIHLSAEHGIHMNSDPENPIAGQFVRAPTRKINRKPKRSADNVDPDVASGKEQKRRKRM